MDSKGELNPCLKKRILLEKPLNTGIDLDTKNTKN